MIEIQRVGRRLDGPNPASARACEKARDRRQRVPADDSDPEVASRAGQPDLVEVYRAVENDTVDTRAVVQRVAAGESVEQILVVALAAGQHVDPCPSGNGI